MSKRPIDISEVENLTNAQLYSLVRLCGKDLSREALVNIRRILTVRSGTEEIDMEIDSALKQKS